MNGRTRLVTMATAVALACLPASAQDLRAFYTGNDLWSRCSDDNTYQSGLCQGFVTGIADAMAVTEGQALDVVKRFLGQHPAERHEEAVSLSLVAQALSEAFPCKP